MHQKTKTVYQLSRSLTVAALLALSATANAGTLFLSNLSGANEIPAGSGAPNATGLGIIIVNDAGTSSTISANWKGIKGITGGRIHLGTPADNGPVTFPFAAVGNPSAPFTWNLSATALNNLKIGALYMDITNGDFPDGAIRGQLFRATLAPAATNLAQNRMANLVLDVAAGISPDLDAILIQTNLAPLAVQRQTLDDLSARTVYAPVREQIETMATLTDSLFAQADENRLNPEAASRRIDTFFKGGESFGHRANTANQQGSRVSRPFGTAGVEFNYSADTRAGLAFGFANAQDRFDGGVGHANTKTTAMNVFFSTKVGAGIALDATIGYGFSNVDYTRNLVSLSRTTTATFEGYVWSGALKASKAFKLGGQATVIPYVFVDAQDARFDGYREDGDVTVGLVIPRITTRNSSAEGGATLLLPFQVSSRTTVTARVQAGWHYLFEDGTASFVGRLQGAPLDLSTEFDRPNRSTAHVEASLTAVLGSRTLTTVGYRGELGADGRTISALEGRAVLRF